MEGEPYFYYNPGGVCLSRIDVTLRINASPGRVWAQFLPERLARWYGPAVQLLTPGPLQKAAQLKVTGAGGPYKAVVTDYTENRFLSWESDNPVRRVAFTLGLKEGATLILLREEVYPRGLIGKLHDKLYLTSAISRQNRRALDQLKRLAETPD